MNRRQEIRQQLRRSRAQEERGALAFGGVRHAGSGNGSRKADVRANGTRWFYPDHILVEYKRTDKQQITLKAADLQKLFDQALVTGRTPVFGLEVGGRDYTVLETGDYEELRALVVSLINELGAADDGDDGTIECSPGS